MTNKCRITLLLKNLTSMLLALLVVTPLYAINSWEVASEEQGIKVSLKTVEGADYKMFRGETIISATIEDLMTALSNSNSSSCETWRFKCSQLVSLGDNHLYQVNNLPWPMTDRFVVTHNVRINKSTMEITHIPVSELPPEIAEKLPEHQDLVEMQDNSGFWKLEEVSKGKVKVTFEIRANPGRSIPTGVINKGALKRPLYTLQKLSDHFASKSE